MEKTIKGFCPECGSPIYDYYIDDDGTNLSECYECKACGNRFSTIIKPEFEIGETVHWNDPCMEYGETEDEYHERCKVPYIVTDIISYSLGDITYRLDNGVEVFESELESAL